MAYYALKFAAMVRARRQNRKFIVIFHAVVQIFAKKVR